MTRSERAELRRAIADYMRSIAYCNRRDARNAVTRLATLLSIPKREDGTFEFAQFETKKG